MYWLLDKRTQNRIRKQVSQVVNELSTITSFVQDDQLFPYVGRKDKRKARVLIDVLSKKQSVVADPFAGSGVFTYAIAESGRTFLSNEFEPYANRLANAPWRLPNTKRLRRLLQTFTNSVSRRMNYLYRTTCTCGYIHVLDTLFFDREPLRYTRVTPHKRLGKNRRNVTYRGRFRCPNCRAKEKHFDTSDKIHLRTIQKKKVSRRFSFRLIENSRINLKPPFTVYRNLFPHRSMVALDCLWRAIQTLKCDKAERQFFEDVLISILPQAKYKDYRSKSQDLHCPKNRLREVNLLYRFQSQFGKRLEGLSACSFAANGASRSAPILCKDFRDIMRKIRPGTVDLVLNDPPWGEGNPYFEKAQLFHPWINYDLKRDKTRLKKEVIVTDAPSRVDKQSYEDWWADITDLFRHSYRILKPRTFMALFFRPAQARNWLMNLNRIKLIARQSGFEPLLSIDVHSKDPSMRVQQSASYTFAGDVIMLFLKLEEKHHRFFIGDRDVDQLIYQSAEMLQEKKRGPFSYREWRLFFREYSKQNGCPAVNKPSHGYKIDGLFGRYCDQVGKGLYLPKPHTPFSSQLFDVRSVERLSTYVPVVVEELTKKGRTFTYTQFLLEISEYVENGTRELIRELQRLDIRRIIAVYARPVGQGGLFRRRPLPALPRGIRKVLELTPYEFENLVARLLKAQGYSRIGVIGRSGDRGVDLQATDPKGKFTVVQCKRYLTTKVASGPIQRLHSYAVTRGASRRIFVTTSDFTPQAKDEAANTNTELINRSSFRRLIATYMPGWA